MERAGDILKDFFSPPPASGAKYLPLFRNWRSIVGRDLEHRVALRDIRKDALIAEAAHPGWLQAVQLRKREIIKRINALYPGIGINDIKVSVVKKAPPRVALPKKREEPVEDAGKPYDGREIDELLSGMSENDLKKALKKLYSAQAKRKRG